MVFTTTSPVRSVVVYTDSAREHIETEHPDMKGQGAAIERVVNDPQFVYRSSSNAPTNPDEFHVYFEWNGHPDYPGYFLAVVVSNDPEPSGVVTAFRQKHIHSVQEEGGLVYVRRNR